MFYIFADIDIAATTTTTIYTCTAATTITFCSSPTLSATSDSNDSFSVGVIVTIVVLTAIDFILIIAVVVGIIIFWKRKCEKHTKAEAAYCGTINEVTSQRLNKSGHTHAYAEMNDEQNIKENVEISKSVHSTKQGDKVTTKHNPMSSERQVKIQDNPAYSVSSGTKIS